MAEFSWSDGLRAAFTSCLPCLHAAPRLPEDDARGGLHGLLADTETDVDADALSLHSQLGGGPRSRRKRRRGPPKAIRVMGWNLFGHAPIRLPDDEEQGEGSGARVQGEGQRVRTLSAATGATLDSDAAPLDAAAIDRLSRGTSHAPSAATPDDADPEEERRKEEDRRRRKRERKERKRAALALALEGPPREPEFEGFQGSGAGAVPSPFRPAALPISPPASSDGTFERSRGPAEYDDEEHDAADFDAGAYTRAPRGVGVGVGGSDGSSSALSRTSGSRSTGTGVSGEHAYYNHHFASQPLASPRGRVLGSPAVADTPTPKAKRTKTAARAVVAPPPLGSPTAPALAGLLSPPAEMPSAGFPSAGLGGRTRSGSSNAGVFLSRRGDE